MLGAHYDGDSEYASTRIYNTVVKRGEEPVTVVSLTGSGAKATAHTVHLTTGEESTIPLAELDVCPFPIGYTNVQGIASYITRKPMRRDYKQGTRINNLYSHCGIHIKEFTMSDMYSAIKGDYPTFSECFKKLSKKSSDYSYAWSRDWAINKDMEVMYQFGRVVGRVADGKPTLNKSSLYLSTLLEESLK